MIVGNRYKYKKEKWFRWGVWELVYIYTWTDHALLVRKHDDTQLKVSAFDLVNIFKTNGETR